jgi:hypothetical protein
MNFDEFSEQDVMQELLKDKDVTVTVSDKPGFDLQIRKVVELSAPLPANLKDNVRHFWEKRRITFLDESEGTLMGMRGSKLWNAVTFDMSKLRSDLSIVFNQQAGTIECVLDVNTSLQQITPMNQMYFVEEMSVFESYLKAGDEQEEAWKEFKQEYSKDNRRWFWRLFLIIGGGMLIGKVFGALLSQGLKTIFGLK